MKHEPEHPPASPNRASSASGSGSAAARPRSRWGVVQRVLRHLRVDAANTHRVLDAAALRRIEARVVASEARHSGEIRVCIETSLPLRELLGGQSVRARALALFGELRVWDTEHNNGVLIYLLVAEHAIEIVADRGLTRHVDAPGWQRIITPMQAAFRAGHFEVGLNAAIDAIDALLDERFGLNPAEPVEANMKPPNPNELPDRPWVL